MTILNSFSFTIFKNDKLAHAGVKQNNGPKWENNRGEKELKRNVLTAKSSNNESATDAGVEIISGCHGKAALCEFNVSRKRQDGGTCCGIRFKRTLRRARLVGAAPLVGSTLLPCAWVMLPWGGRGELTEFAMVVTPLDVRLSAALSPAAGARIRLPPPPPPHPPPPLSLSFYLSLSFSLPPPPAVTVNTLSDSSRDRLWMTLVHSVEANRTFWIVDNVVQTLFRRGKLTKRSESNVNYSGSFQGMRKGNNRVGGKKQNITRSCGLFTSSFVSVRKK